LIRALPVLGAIALLGPGCSGANASTDPQPIARSGATNAKVLHFAYETLDGKALSTETLAGRFTLIGFVATYDMASQAEARFLGSLLRRHTPRINVALLALESPENQPLVQAFVQSMGLEYPVAMADAATIAGEGPFAGLHHVPSVVLLDREGRERWRHVGLADEATIDKALRDAEAEERRR
jgi:hypothetical protein